jgi:hypothetical protein
VENAGGSMNEWSMEFAGGSETNFVFYEGPNLYLGGLDVELWKEVLEPNADSELWKMYETAYDNRTGDGEMRYESEVDLCKKLRSESLKALSSIK